MKEKFIALLTFTSSLKSFGIKFIRVAILVVFEYVYVLLWAGSSYHEHRHPGFGESSPGKQG